MPFEYQPKTIQQLKNTYNSKVRNDANGFENFEDFFDWYHEQELVCQYCGLKEEEMQEISMTGILISKRFPQNGIVGQGTSRGVWLELDRIVSTGLYSRDNCVLCCYFCNNDKSDVFNGDIYKNFFQNRVTFLRQLLNDNRPKE